MFSGCVNTLHLTLDCSSPKRLSKGKQPSVLCEQTCTHTHAHARTGLWVESLPSVKVRVREAPLGIFSSL